MSTEITTLETLSNVLQAPRLDPVLLGIANLHIQGKSHVDISVETGVPLDRISLVLDHPDVKTYVSQVYRSSGWLNKFKRVELLSKMVETHLEQVELGEAKLTKKDLLDVLDHLRKLEADDAPKQKAPQVAVQVNNNYENLLKELTSK